MTECTNTGLSGAMDDTHKSQQKCIYLCTAGILVWKTSGAVLKGYEPNEPYGAVMSRSFRCLAAAGIMQQLMELAPVR